MCAFISRDIVRVATTVKLQTAPIHTEHHQYMPSLLMRYAARQTFKISFEEGFAIPSTKCYLVMD